MDTIPVTFEYHGKEYKGELTKVAGAGNTAMFHLSVDNLHWGQLSYVEGHKGLGYSPPRQAGWRFTSNQYDLVHLADYFGNIVELWYE
jgi:hypothetical protein